MPQTCTGEGLRLPAPAAPRLTRARRPRTAGARNPPAALRGGPEAGAALQAPARPAGLPPEPPETLTTTRQDGASYWGRRVVNHNKYETRRVEHSKNSKLKVLCMVQSFLEVFVILS